MKRGAFADYNLAGLGPRASLGLTLAAFVSSRGLLIERTLYGANMPGLLVGSDVGIYELWSQEAAAGQLSMNPGWQYPPLALALFFSISLLPLDYFRAFVAVAVVADVVIFIGLMCSAFFRRCSPLGPLYWALGGFIISPMILVRFDIVPAMFLVLALTFGYRTYLTPGLLGLGAALKVWPAVSLISSPPKSAVRAVAVFTAVVALTTLAVGMAVGNVWQFLANSTGRGLQVEAPVTSLIYLYSLVDAAPISREQRFGSLEITGTAADTLASGVTVVLVVLLALLAYLRYAGPLKRSLPTDVTFLAVSSFVLLSKVGSPQFAVWLLAAAALALSFSETQLRGPIALVSLYIAITGRLFADGFSGYSLLIEGAPQIVLLHSLRSLMLLLAVVWGIRILWKAGNQKCTG